MAKRITQAELQQLLDDEIAVNRRTLQIRRRILKGAEIEPGPLIATTEPGEEDDPRIAGSENMGLSILPLSWHLRSIEDLNQQVRDRQRAKRREAASEPRIPTEESQQFAELVRLWRLDHPEPPKPRTFPKGITQHESDPDTD